MISFQQLSLIVDMIAYYIVNHHWYCHTLNSNWKVLIISQFVCLLSIELWLAAKWIANQTFLFYAEFKKPSWLDFYNEKYLINWGIVFNWGIVLPCINKNSYWWRFQESTKLIYFIQNLKIHHVLLLMYKIYFIDFCKYLWLNTFV